MHSFTEKQKENKSLSVYEVMTGLPQLFFPPWEIVSLKTMTST